MENLVVKKSNLGNAKNTKTQKAHTHQLKKSQSKKRKRGN